MAQRLRNHVVLSETPPTTIIVDATDPDDIVTRDPIDGDLWVNSTNYTMNVFDSNEANGPTVGWIGVTDRSQTGSIVYFSDNAPDLLDMYPALSYLPDGTPITNIDVSPLPGTMWYETTNMLLKIYLVSSANSSGSWVSVTSAHYMTQAVQRGLEDMDTRVAALEAQLDALGGNP